jgi:solute carrier family 13 (sodium-dependent dicarboxylate transporter), member 2/3/5
VALIAALLALPAPAQGALLIFAAAIVAWTVFDLDETPVALCAALALLGVGATTLPRFYAGLGDDFVWLLVGAFVLSAVLQRSGLAERWALRAVAAARTPRGLMLRLTAVITATAFVVPSTSGRAALLLPVFLVLAHALQGTQPRLVRALALLFPSVILLSACVSMLGAGAHLVALDFMQRVGAPVPGFLGWALWAAPFGVLSSLLACELILRLFLTGAERGVWLQLPAPAQEPLTRPQMGAAAVALLALAAWSTTALHGLPAPLVAVLAALAATVKPLTGVDMKTALKQVEWNLVLFMAATLVMGDALISSGAAAGLSSALVGALSLDRLPTPAVLALVVLLALLAHLVVTSRTARATVLIPTVALPLAGVGAGGGLDGGLLIFVVVIGSGFCQTLTLSAKPVALFAGDEAPRYSSRDLVVLAAALLPGLWTLLMLFAAVVWPWQGLG